jgi:two-component system cell cycle response regulator DivK
VTTPQSRKSAAVACSTRRVLVVDDSADARELLTTYLTFRRFQVSAARHGEEAIGVARSVRPDIILMDLWMPGIDGWEATRRLKADPVTKTAIILAVSAHAFPPEREAADDAGCDGFVVKPYDLIVLARALERILAKGVVGFDVPGITVKTPPTAS